MANYWYKSGNLEKIVGSTWLSSPSFPLNDVVAAPAVKALLDNDQSIESIIVVRRGDARSFQMYGKESE